MFQVRQSQGRFRDSTGVPKLIIPNKTYEYTIELHPTSNLFKVRHRIRLNISSSDLPCFDRNHNTGAKDCWDPKLISPIHTIFHDKKHPSRVILPTIPYLKNEP